MLTSVIWSNIIKFSHLLGSLKYLHHLVAKSQWCKKCKIHKDCFFLLLLLLFSSLEVFNGCMIQTEKEKIEKLRLFFTKLKAVLSWTCNVLKLKSIIRKKIEINCSQSIKPLYKGPSINDVPIFKEKRGQKRGKHVRIDYVGWGGGGQNVMTNCWCHLWTALK